MGCYFRHVARLALLPLAALAACSEPHADAVERVRAELPVSAVLEFERVGPGRDPGTVCGVVREVSSTSLQRQSRIFRVEADGYVRWMEEDATLTPALLRWQSRVRSSASAELPELESEGAALRQRVNAQLSAARAFYAGCAWEDELEELEY